MEGKVEFYRESAVNIAYPIQNLQDWVTQQWVITAGRKIDPYEFPWLIGPFGNLNGIGEDIIFQLAQKENLKIIRNAPSAGLLSSIADLNLSVDESELLSEEVIRFYEKTADCHMNLRIRWNPFFRILGILINQLFSRRLNQLYIPPSNGYDTESVTSEIIRLADPDSEDIKYTIWLRKIQRTGQIIFSGIYGTCRLPSGKTGVKAVFPLPMGNATVIMLPRAVRDGSLRLDSKGREFGDAGFYFLLKDAKDDHWAKFVSSFHDDLTIGFRNGKLSAEQNFCLWGKNVMRFHYDIY